jgi:hypothetical protein
MDETARIEMDLSIASIDAIELFLDEAEDQSIFEEILVANRTRPEAIKLVYDHSGTPDELREEAASILSLPVPSKTEIEARKKETIEKKEHQPREERKKRLAQTVDKLNISEKVKIAMKGNSEVRGVLLRETNKMVVLAVLKNPKITESEIEATCKNRAVIEEALRAISKNKEWMRHYGVKHALVNNPKTPPGIAIRYVPYLKKNDLKMLEKNKNVAEVVRTTAKKFVKGKGV